MPPRISRLATALLFIAGITGWTACAFMLSGLPVLGHDEAQYAIAAHDWLAGAPTRWNYLSWGMNLIAAPGLLVGGAPRVLRVLPMVFGLGFVLAAAHLAFKLAGERSAAWLVATLAATIALAKRSAELLSDLPAALCLLIAIGVIVDEIDRKAGPRWRVVWVAPLMAAAFYLRYGSALAIAAIGIAVLIVGRRAIAARPGPVIATVAVLGVLLVPHFAMSIARTGSPLGIMRECSHAIGSGVAASMVTYVTANPFTYYGLTAPVLITGVLAVVRIRDRRRALLWAIAVLDLAILGLTPTPQARYLALGLALLALLGVDALEQAAARLRPALQAWVGALAVIALVGAWVATEVSAHSFKYTAKHRMTNTLLAADAIHADAAGRPCLVVGRHTTQLQWYSGCEAVNGLVPDEVAPAMQRARVYVVLDPDAPDTWPALAGVRQRPVLHRREAIVTQLEPAGARVPFGPP